MTVTNQSPQPQPAPDILDTALAAALVLAVASRRWCHAAGYAVHYDIPQQLDVLIGLRHDGSWDVAVYGRIDGKVTELFAAIGEQTTDGERIAIVRGIAPFEEWRPVVLAALRTVADGASSPA